MSWTTTLYIWAQGLWRRKAVPRGSIQRAKYFSLAILTGENIPGFGELPLEGTKGFGSQLSRPLFCSKVTFWPPKNVKFLFRLFKLKSEGE